MPGLLGSLLSGLGQNLLGTVQEVAAYPGFIIKNYTGAIDSALTTAQGDIYPDDSFKPGGVNDGALAPVGKNAGSPFGASEITYKLTRDVTFETGGKYGKPYKVSLKLGDIISFNAAGDSVFSRTGGYYNYDINAFKQEAGFNKRINDPFLGADGKGRDLNGDGFAEKTFSNNNAQDWIIWGKSPELLQSYSNSSLLDSQNWNFLPRELQNSYAPGSYANNDGIYTSAIGDKEWLVTRKPMNYSGLLPNSIYNVFNPNGVPSNYPDAYQFNAQGPGQYLNTMNSTASLFNGPATTTHLKVVDAATLSNNQVLTDLKYWLTQIDPATGRPHTFQNGILSSAGPWTATFQVPGATPADPPVDKPVINAYVNQIGELVVEYA